MDWETRRNNYIIIGDNFQEDQDYQLALESYKKALDYSGPGQRQELYYKLALLLDLESSHREAIHYYDLILKEDQAQAGAYYGRAIAYEDLGDYDLAEENYLLAIKYNRSYGKAYYYLATLYDKMDRKDLAIENYKLAIEVDKEDYLAYNDLAGAYEELGRYREAMDLINRSILIKDDYYRSHYNRGVILARLGHYQEADLAYRKSIEINPYYGFNFLNISAIYLDQKDYQATVDILSQGLIYNPEDTNLYYNRACAYAHLGRDHLARQDLDRAIELSPLQRQYAENDQDLQRFFKEC